MRMRIVLLLAIASFAHAADQTILGNQLLVKDASAPDKRKVAISGKDVGANTLVGNPTASGATLTVSLTGGTPST